MQIFSLLTPLPTPKHESFSIPFFWFVLITIPIPDKLKEGRVFHTFPTPTPTPLFTPVSISLRYYSLRFLSR
ncbi:hypothetical protein RIF29_12008 [Crotalaria pallida]|uniref:Uncharacterized protein n=1 Tax=Crotalaria pallida TaxID=3830 RepID=A0AAN9IMQ9_CROPI